MMYVMLTEVGVDNTEHPILANLDAGSVLGPRLSTGPTGARTTMYHTNGQVTFIKEPWEEIAMTIGTVQEMWHREMTMRHARADYDRIQDPSGKIPIDEPVFLLRAQDCCAWQAVLVWADLNDSAGGDPEMSKLARKQAAAMQAWPKKKVPDLPATPLDPSMPASASGSADVKPSVSSSASKKGD